MALMENSELISSFEQLGLSPNEAKVYLALLENHPITGYQLSKNSGILRPVVYEMLNRLVEKGGARIVKSNPDTYMPVEIDEFLRNIEEDFSSARKQITGDLKGFLAVEESDFFWNITGKKSIFNAAISMIESAQKSILIGAQSQAHLNLISEAMSARLSAENPPEITLFSYFALNTEGATTYSFNLDRGFTNPRINPNLLSICVDESQALLANMVDDKTCKAVQSKNQALIHLVHDDIQKRIYDLRLYKLFGPEKIKTLLDDEDRKLIDAIDKHLSHRVY